MTKIFTDAFEIFKPEDKIYKCFIDVIQLFDHTTLSNHRLSTETEEKIKQKLEHKYNSELDDILSTLKDPKRVLDNIDDILFECKECNTCSILNSCNNGLLQPKFMELAKKFENILEIY